jgi:hypothetical protein
MQKMDIFSSGFIAKISYLEDKIAKILKNSPWGHFGGILGKFLVFGIIPKNLYVYFLQIKKNNV